MVAVPEGRQQLNASWRRRFEILDRIDGDYFRRWKELSTEERVAVGFRWLPFVCSFVYYVAKGMWEKGLLLATAYAVLGIVLGAMGVPGVVVWWCWAGVCAACATSDYYKRVEHGERIWPVVARRMPRTLASTPALAILAAATLGCHVVLAMRS